jgi:hypothetical protein
MSNELLIHIIQTSTNEALVALAEMELQERELEAYQIRMRGGN